MNRQTCYSQTLQCTVYIQWQVHITQSKDTLKILSSVRNVLLDFTTNLLCAFIPSGFFLVFFFCFNFCCVVMGIRIKQTTNERNVSMKEPLEFSQYIHRRSAVRQHKKFRTLPTTIFKMRNNMFASTLNETKRRPIYLRCSLWMSKNKDTICEFRGRVPRDKLTVMSLSLSLFLHCIEFIDNTPHAFVSPSYIRYPELESFQKVPATLRTHNFILRMLWVKQSK